VLGRRTELRGRGDVASRDLLEDARRKGGVARRALSDSQWRRATLCDRCQPYDAVRRQVEDRKRQQVARVLHDEDVAPRIGAFGHLGASIERDEDERARAVTRVVVRRGEPRCTVLALAKLLPHVGAAQCWIKAALAYTRNVLVGCAVKAE
jgi:hypothetical protein